MLFAKADQLSRLSSSFLLKAEKLSSSLIMGFHGRKQSGTGEEFWQFRPMQTGDTAQSIDWRQSAKRQDVHIREHEWQAAQKVLLTPFFSKSMDYASTKELETKKERAQLIALTLCFLFHHSGELFSMKDSGLGFANSKNHIAKIADHLFSNQESGVGDNQAVATGNQKTLPIFIGDFLDDIQTIKKELIPFCRQKQNGYLFQILDPAELSFPFSGRTLFKGFQQEQEEFQKAETIRKTYLARFNEHQQALKKLCENLGITYITHSTDQKPDQAFIEFLRKAG